MLNIIFGLFFIFPIMGFLLFAFKYNALEDEYLPFFFLGVLVFSLCGLLVLRRLFDKISRISHEVTEKAGTFTRHKINGNNNEIQNLVDSFSAIENQLGTLFQKLGKKTSEISILKELSELCYVTFDPEEIMHVTLERAMLITKSDIGSVLMLSQGDPRQFVVRATFGLGERLRLGDRIDFATSIAKYAVINKSPLIVADVEKDWRFGRMSREHYGTNAFICMPLKTSNEIIGVLTLSRKKDSETLLSSEDVEALTPLLSNAAFTFENLRLIKQNKKDTFILASIDRIFKIINSSFKDRELIRAVLREINEVIPFSFAMLLMKDEKKSDGVSVVDVYSNGPVPFAKGSSYTMGKESVLEQVFNQEISVVIQNTDELTDKDERALFEKTSNKAGLFAPVSIKGTVRGALVLVGEDQEIFFQAKSFIDWMVSGISLAIQRNTLSSSLNRRNHELDAIRQIGSALASSTFDLKQVLKYTMDMIKNVMRVDAGSLFFLEDNELRFAVSFNVDLEASKDIRLKLGQGIAGYVAARGESLIVNDIKSSGHFFPGVDEITGFVTTSALCVPMISQGKVIGVIEVLNKQNSQFTRNDEELLKSIASSVSIAIENARLYQETVTQAESERAIRRVFQKFVPKEILDKILYGDDPEKTVINEFKTVTLLNIDIRGFSTASRRIGPQKTVAQLNHFFSSMGNIVFKYGGIVDKYLGDGFLALFGAPASSTRDADNAVEAALKMQEIVIEFLDFWGEETPSVPLEIGISIHTGEVVVGNIGFDRKMDYTVIGDTVNEVFRLQQVTKLKPNSIVISGSTKRAATSKLNLSPIPVPEAFRDIFEEMGIYELHNNVQEQPKNVLPHSPGPAQH